MSNSLSSNEANANDGNPPDRERDLKTPPSDVSSTGIQLDSLNLNNGGLTNVHTISENGGSSRHSLGNSSDSSAPVNEMVTAIPSENVNKPPRSGPLNFLGNQLNQSVHSSTPLRRKLHVHELFENDEQFTENRFEEDQFTKNRFEESSKPKVQKNPAILLNALDHQATASLQEAKQILIQQQNHDKIQQSEINRIISGQSCANAEVGQKPTTEEDRKKESFEDDRFSKIISSVTESIFQKIMSKMDKVVIASDSRESLGAARHITDIEFNKNNSSVALEKATAAPSKAPQAKNKVFESVKNCDRLGPSNFHDNHVNGGNYASQTNWPKNKPQHNSDSLQNISPDIHYNRVDTGDDQIQAFQNAESDPNAVAKENQRILDVGRNIGQPQNQGFPGRDQLLVIRNNARMNKGAKFMENPQFSGVGEIGGYAENPEYAGQNQFQTVQNNIDNNHNVRRLENPQFSSVGKNNGQFQISDNTGHVKFSPIQNNNGRNQSVRFRENSQFATVGRNSGQYQKSDHVDQDRFSTVRDKTGTNQDAKFTGNSRFSGVGKIGGQFQKQNCLSHGQVLSSQNNFGPDKKSRFTGDQQITVVGENSGQYEKPGFVKKYQTVAGRNNTGWNRNAEFTQHEGSSKFGINGEQFNNQESADHDRFSSGQNNSASIVQNNTGTTENSRFIENQRYPGVDKNNGHTQEVEFVNQNQHTKVQTASIDSDIWDEEMSIEGQRIGLDRTPIESDKIEAPKRVIPTRSQNQVLETTALHNPIPRKKARQNEPPRLNKLQQSNLRQQKPSTSYHEQANQLDNRFSEYQSKSFNLQKDEKVFEPIFQNRGQNENQTRYQQETQNFRQTPNQGFSQYQHTQENWDTKKEAPNHLTQARCDQGFQSHGKAETNVGFETRQLAQYQSQNTQKSQRFPNSNVQESQPQTHHKTSSPNNQLMHFKNPSLLTDYRDLSDARKRAFTLSTNTRNIITFTPDSESIGYFLIGKLTQYAESAMLWRISLILPWLHHTLPTVPPIQFKQAREKANIGLDDNDVETFLIRLARLIHGRGKPHASVALQKTHEENISGYAQRLIIEFDTIQKQSFDEFRSEADLVSDVFFHMTCHETDTVRLQMNQAVTYGNYGKITEMNKLLKITQSVDQILIIQNPSGMINTMNLNEKGSKNDVNCRKCQKLFIPEKSHYFECKPCFAEKHFRPCKTCKKSFYLERAEHESCRDCFLAERKQQSQRGRSPDGFNSHAHSNSTNQRSFSNDRRFTGDRRENRDFSRNRRDYSKDRREYSRDRRDRKEVDHRGGSREDTRGRSDSYNKSLSEGVENFKNGFFTKGQASEIIAKGSSENQDREQKIIEKGYGCAISRPITGEEHYLSTSTITEDNISNKLRPLGVPHTRDRIILDVEIIEMKTAKMYGKALIDSGANLNTIAKTCCEKSGIKINRFSSSYMVKDFEGNDCPTVGYAEVQLRIGRSIYKNIFTVVNSFGPDVILGTPYLESIGLMATMANRISEVTGLSRRSNRRNSLAGNSACIFGSSFPGKLSFGTSGEKPRGTVSAISAAESSSRDNDRDSYSSPIFENLHEKSLIPNFESSGKNSVSEKIADTLQRPQQGLKPFNQVFPEVAQAKNSIFKPQRKNLRVSFNPKIATKVFPGQSPIISEKMKKQIDSIRNLATARLKISEQSSKPRRSITIHSRSNLKLEPYASSTIDIAPVCELNSSNFLFDPSILQSPIYKFTHFTSAIINSDVLWLPVYNTSDKVLTIQAGTKLGGATELTEYDIAIPDDGNIHIDSLTLYCADDEELENPWESIYDEFEGELSEMSSESIHDNHPTISSACGEANNLTSREKAVEEFQTELLTYPEDERSFLSGYEHIFTPKTDWGHNAMNITPIKLPLKNDHIVPTPPLAKRRYTQRDQEVIDLFIERSLKSGLISPIQSPTTSALHVVYKNGKPRVVSDLRAVNSLNAGEFQYTFPRPQEVIRNITGKGYEFFSQLDLSGAFLQVPLDPESYPLLSFTAMTNIHSGTYCYRFLNFGFKSSPAIFSTVLDKVLYKINSNDVAGATINYFDDICVGAKSKEDHFKILERLFGRFSESQVTLNLSKSKFFKPNCEFCSFLISKDGYRLSDNRLKLLRTYPDYDVRSKKKNSDLKILGFLNYHRGFCQDYAKFDRRIRDTIKKFKLHRITADEANAEIKECSDTIKARVCETALESAGPEETCHLQTDASGRSYGYVLFTKRGVIQYGGGTFAESVGSSHSIFEKELRSLGYALQDLFHILTSTGKLIIECDNIAAVFSSTAAKTKRPISSRAIKYIQIIQTYTSCLDSMICHIATSKNLLSDCLSRMHYDDEGNFDFTATASIHNNYATGEVSAYQTLPELFSHFETATQSIVPFVQNKPEVGRDPKISFAFGNLNQTKKADINNCSLEKPETENDCSDLEPTISTVHAKNYIPDNFTPLSKATEFEYIKNLHAQTHWSPSKTKFTLQGLGYNISAKTIERVWNECLTCGALRRLAPRSKLNSRIYDTLLPLASITLDHVDMVRHRSSCNKCYIITVLCDVTRMAFATGVVRKNTQPVVNFLDQIQAMTGKRINKVYMDNAFDCHIFDDWSSERKIELTFRPSHQSRSVLIERYHRTLHKSLSNFCGTNMRLWPKYLPLAMTSMNTQISEAHGFQPTYLFNGLRSDPEGSPLLDPESDYSFHLRLARSILNCLKRERSAQDFTYRTLPSETKIIVRYNHDKNSREYNATVVHDPGSQHSTVSVKLENRPRALKIHKSDIYVKKDSPEFSTIFADLRILQADKNLQNLTE